jgi:hypothetical protein
VAGNAALGGDLPRLGTGHPPAAPGRGPGEALPGSWRRCGLRHEWRIKVVALELSTTTTTIIIINPPRGRPQDHRGRRRRRYHDRTVVPCSPFISPAISPIVSTVADRVAGRNFVSARRGAARIHSVPI